MTLVGITQRMLPPNEVGEQRHALDSRWYAFLAACGLTPVPLPNLPDTAVDTARRTGVRGLVLSGGDDLVEHGGSFPERDETERRLVAWARSGRVPVLGVCRGMEVIVRTWGGTLTPVDGHVATRHDVRTRDGTRSVNSFHALAATAVPGELEVTAACDGVVEAVRHRDEPVVGVMWHPEREDPFVAADVADVGELFGGER